MKMRVARRVAAGSQGCPLQPATMPHSARNEASFPDFHFFLSLFTAGAQGGAFWYAVKIT
jgi:hypothetical protein